MAEKTQLLSHWARMVEDLNQSTQAFYGLVEQAVERRKMVKVEFKRVDFREGGIFSASREYLRIRRGDLRYDICGAPFGNGFFVSSRLFAEGDFAEGILRDMQQGGLVAGTAGAIIGKLVGSDTYYKYDTEI